MSRQPWLPHVAALQVADGGGGGGGAGNEADTPPSAINATCVILPGTTRAELKNKWKNNFVTAWGTRVTASFVIRLSQRISADDVPRGARAARRHRAGPRDPACTPKSPGDIYYICVTARHLPVSPLHARRPAFCAFAQVEGPPRAPPSPWFHPPPSPCPTLSPCPITITLQYKLSITNYNAPKLRVK